MQLKSFLNKNATNHSFKSYNRSYNSLHDYKSVCGTIGFQPLNFRRDKACVLFAALLYGAYGCPPILECFRLGVPSKDLIDIRLFYGFWHRI